MMTGDDDDDSGEEMDIEISPKITTYLDAIKSLENVQLFLEKQGHVAEANNLAMSRIIESKHSIAVFPYLSLYINSSR